jgi:hypothetical protein
MASTERIKLPTVEEYDATERVLQAAFDAVEKVTWPLRRLIGYDPADWDKLYERPPTDADVSAAFSFLDQLEVQIEQLRNELDEGRKGLSQINFARLEVAWSAEKADDA